MSQISQDNATTTPTANSEPVNLTLNHINKLLIGVTLAQSRGAYTFEDSVELAETVKLVTKFIKVNNDAAAKEQEQKQKSQTS
jgi:hypothetical protein